MFLALLFTASTTRCSIPAIWKTSTIIPLLKPGKDPKSAASYRPISLLCPAAKILESLILPSLVTHLPPAKHQHGFRPLHSTVSALLNLSSHISEGFNEKLPPGRTVVVALDLSKAFDSVDQTKLVNMLYNSSLPTHLVKWLSHYLRGRQAKTSFRDTVSPSHVIHTGVPQGSVISPALFNAYLADLPRPTKDVHLVSYADDITVFATGPKIEPLVAHINAYLDQLSTSLADKKLIISATKSTTSLFTPNTREARLHPQVCINNQLLPLERRPKILGVTFDTMFTFADHIKSTATKIQRRNNILRALCGTNWGQHKETILTTYKAIGRSVINYAAPIWSTIAARSHFERLQRTQNTALRLATGCHMMSAADHLHQETMMLPVEPHCRLLTDQYYASCYDHAHPCHFATHLPQPKRWMKHTLPMFSGERVAKARTAAADDIKQSIKLLHTEAVTRVKNAYLPNRVLNQEPPPINQNEQSLPRSARCRLSQLRSGWSNILQSYKNKIDPRISNICPNCDRFGHDVNHLFSCPANPTQLNVTSSWTNPVTSAHHLKLC